MIDSTHDMGEVETVISVRLLGKGLDRSRVTEVSHQVCTLYTAMSEQLAELDKQESTPRYAITFRKWGGIEINNAPWYILEDEIEKEES